MKYSTLLDWYGMYGAVITLDLQSSFCTILYTKLVLLRKVSFPQTYSNPNEMLALLIKANGILPVSNDNELTTPEKLKGRKFLLMYNSTKGSIDGIKTIL